MQDWSLSRWEKEISESSQDEINILRKFVSKEGSQLQQDPTELAKQVKVKIASALYREEWELLCRYQNKRISLHASSSLSSKHAYLDDSLCATSIFKREFPLGVHPSIFEDEKKKWEFAVHHSGLTKTDHRDNVAITCLLYTSMIAIVIMGISFLMYYMVGKTSLWNLVEGTVQDTSDPEFSTKLNRRTKERGTVASILSALTFSLTVNASIDAIGRIDPSTSTVFIGMLLGNTFGFVLDNAMGSDEGFREYRWNSMDGMKYGIGSLGTSRYARYLITIVFDMFFTVIFFKLLYCRIVRLAGFSNEGREWIANGMCSFFISFLTYQVYSNMTRFEYVFSSFIFVSLLHI
jgi:hypothetical protein